uniref:long-chain-fatty-acid--CoA ligase n=1 Tax=Sinocyclocheilus rhinocerous TaxID=307959 RepID=A0A673L8R8_9TELE
MQSRDLLLGLQLPELDDLGQFLRSLPTSALLGLGALTAVLAYWISTRPRPITPPCDLRLQSQEVQMEDGARRSMMGDSSTLLSYYHEDAKTMYEVFQRGLHITGDGPFLGSRLPNQPYTWLSYREVLSRAELLGSGLLSQGCQPSPDQFIGVFAQNRPEWIISELACYTYSMVVVPLYDTLGPDAIRYIINRAEISTVICDKAEKAAVLLENVQRGETPGLKTIVLMDVFDAPLLEEAQKSGVLVRSLRDVEALGRENYRKPVPPGPDDLSIVCFTSGTTGESTQSFSSELSFVYLKNSEYFSEELKGAVVICHGGRIGFFQGDIRLLSDDMKALRPTIFPVVPRLLNRMYDKIFSQANTSLKRWLLNFAAKRKGLEVKRGVIRCDSVWDKIFFHKIQVRDEQHWSLIAHLMSDRSPDV